MASSAARALRPLRMAAWRPQSPLSAATATAIGCCRCRCRRFHVSALVTVPVDTAEALISQLHVVSGVPWYVTIPLVALGVNLVVRLPFSIHARWLAQGRTRLAPLLQGWAAVHSKEIHEERRRDARERKRLDQQAPEAAAAAAPPPPPPIGTMDRDVMKRYRRTASRVHAKFGVQQWKLYSNFLAMPPWLVVIEAIRRMCGAPVGLLGLILRRTGSEAVDVTGVDVTGVDVTGVDVAAAADVAVAAVDVTAGDVAAATSTAAALSEPSLVTGGCLWFPDLTVADPYHILPFALSAMLLANVMPSTDAGRRALFGLAPKTADDASGTTQITTEGAAARGLQRTLLLMSLSVGFVTMQFPSAIHLYWLASAGSSFLITHSVRVAMPLQELDIRPGNKVDYPWIRPPPPSVPPPPLGQ